MKYKEFKKWYDEWIEMIRRLTPNVPEKPKAAEEGRNWSQPIAAYGCPSITPNDRYYQQFNTTTSQATTRLDNEQQT